MHPFVRGIGDGTVNPARFRYYVRQDYLFLIEYARLLALACARAPDVETMTRFAELARDTLTTEMNLHREYAQAWGISTAELEAEQPASTTRAYTDFLLRTAALGDFGELVAALLPCMWGYSELACSLTERGHPDHELYSRWIQMYASDEFAELTAWCRQLCDDTASPLGPQARTRMRTAFLRSSRYELAFWEMAWRAQPTED
jgi:thiaminase/transcriptional activator TenA